MSLVLFVVVTSAFTALALGLRGREGMATAIGLLGLAAAVVAAISIVPGQKLVVGGGELVATAYLRLFLILGSVIGLALAIAGRAGATRRDAPAVSLGVLAAAALTLGLPDPRQAVLAAAAGGLFGVLVTLVPSSGRAGATVGIREIRAVVVAGALAIAATAWIGRDLSQLTAQPVVFGLAYLAFVVAVALRFGAIPFHLWAARLADVVPETALPILTAFAPATMAVVAVAWIDSSVVPLGLDLGVERVVILAIAIASIGLAAVAAFVQDDIEHVLGYSIVGDAGVVILALAAVGPESWPPARMWILAFVVARSAFAAWAAAIRTGFWTGRVADLRGWALRSPILAAAFVLVVIASVGFPGLAVYDARVALVNDILTGPLAIVVAIGTVAPLAYYGRLLVIGLMKPDRVADPVSVWHPVVRRPDVTATRAWLGTTWDANRAFTTATVSGLLALLAVATSAGWFGGPAAAAEPAPVVTIPREIVLPSPSSSGAPSPSPSGALPSPTEEPPSPSPLPSAVLPTPGSLPSPSGALPSPSTSSPGASGSVAP